MKQPSLVPVYTDTDKQKHLELCYQLKEKRRLLDELDYQRAKGSIDTVQHTRLQVQVLMEYDMIRKEIIGITK